MPKHDEFGHRKRLQTYLRNHSGPSGSPSSDLWRQGMLDFSQLDVDASVLWVPIGPSPLIIEGDQIYQGKGPNAGQVTDIAIDPAEATDNVIYISTNDGGIWRTEDAGAHWQQNMDDLLSLSMGAVAVDNASPPIQRILYAGTGNMYDGGRFFTKGIGIFRSPDGGATWSIVDGGPFATVFAGFAINDIAVIAPDTLLVATNQGLFRSVDGGQNFGSNAPAFDDRKPVVPGLITCVLPDVTDPANTIYACVSAVGVVQSGDGGKTFPNNLLGAATPQLVSPFGQIQLAQSGLNAKVLYAIVQYTPPNNGAPVCRGLFQTMDGGTTWNMFANISNVVGASGLDQSDYDMNIALDPQIAVGANTGWLYVAFKEIFRSKGGGQVFEPAACSAYQAHWDNHVLCMSPPGHRPANQPTGIYAGSDGGIAKSIDGGNNWTPVNGNLASNLFLGLDIGRGSAANNAYTYGGMQDTGIAGHRPGDNVTEWHAGINGDGGPVAVDPLDPTIVYAFDDEYFVKTTDAGATWLDTWTFPLVIGTGLPTLKPAVRAIALEPNGADKTKRIVYVGVLQKLYKSKDSGVSFLTANLTVGPNSSYHIVSIAVSKGDSNRVWVGANDGQVHYSADAGATWDQGSFNTQPGGTGPVNGIAIDPASDPAKPDRVAVVYGGVSGIHSKYRTQRIFLTTDGGVTWNDVSGTDGNGPLGNLPDLPMHSVVFDSSTTPAALIVASDAGVMRSTDISVTGGNVTATWKLYGVGLPTVSCSSLAIDNAATPRVLRVGTYGRSCFEMSKPSGARLYCSPAPAFGSVVLGGKGTLPVYLYNCGDAQLNVTGITITSSPNFAFDPAPAYPIAINPGAGQTLNLVFTPAAAGDDTALLSIDSNDATSPAVLNASGRGVAKGKPRLALNPVKGTSFGTASADRSVVVQIFNVGTDDLTITGIQLGGSSDFSLDPVPTFPLTIAAGAENDLTVKYHPTSNGPAKATLTINSNDLTPSYVYNVSGTGNVSSSNWLTILEYVGIGLLAAGAVVGGVVLAEKLSEKKSK